MASPLFLSQSSKISLWHAYMRIIDDMLRAALREKRKSLGISSKQMAAILGVHTSTFTNWETGKAQKCSYANYRKITFAIEGLFDSVAASINNQTPSKELLDAMTRHRNLLDKLEVHPHLIDEYIDALEDLSSKYL